LGYTYGDFEEWDNDLMKVICSDDIELVKNEIEKYYHLKDDASYEYNSRLTHKNGDWRYFKTLGTVLRKSEDGSPKSFLFIAQDISDQIRTSEELKKNIQLVSDSEKLLKFGTYSHNMLTGEMVWSDGMYEILGYEKNDSVIINEGLYLKHVDALDRDMYIAKIDEAVKNKANFHIIYHLTTKNGEKKIVSTNGTVIATNKRIFGITRDITQSELMELELRQNIKTLNQSNKELEEFAYVASHDMQEPLRKIQTFGERLQTKYGDVLTDDGKVYLNRIMSSAEIMRSLIDNLLEFSRITRRTQIFEPTDLNIIIKTVSNELELLFDETNAKLVVDSMLPLIEAIPLQMRQLFTNLISNAIKFRKKDTDPVIHISCRLTDNEERKKHMLHNDINYYSISIADNGIGFEQDYAEKIFQIFQRLHGKSEYPGSGIGLAICKKIIDHHQGAIYAEGEPQKGATFTIILPLIQTKANATTEE
jgi:signal transduction histidine kinase